MKNIIQKRLNTEHRNEVTCIFTFILNTCFCLLLTAFFSLTANADPIDETYRESFYIMTLARLNTVPGSFDNVFEYRDRMLALTGGVMPTNVKVGFSSGIAFMRATQGEYYNYLFAQNFADPIIETAVASDTPYGGHINGTPWSDDADQSIDNALNFLENYNVGENLQVDRGGYIRKSIFPQDPEYTNEVAAGFPALEMHLTLSRNNNMVQKYLRRNNIIATRLMNWYREQHPELVIFSSMSSEYQQNQWSNGDYSDYSSWSKQEFRDWLSGSGLYTGIGQYADLSTFNSAFSGAPGFPWASWSAVQPPTSENWSTVSANGRWWNKWHEFRVAQVKNIEQAQINWTYEAGWSPDLIYGHQQPLDPSSTDGAVRRNCGYWTTTFVDEGGNGITTYNEEAANLVLFGTIYNNDKNWGSFEYNRLISGVANNLAAINNFWTGKGHIVCPGFWGGEDPYRIKDRDFETALQQFVANKFADSFTHIKSYEAAPTAKDVIWTMSDSGDMETFVDLNSQIFTNGVMSATVNGSVPYVSLELDESKHYLKSDNYYAASFRIFVSNSAVNTGKFLWHENSGGNHQIEFPLRDGWNVYKINLMESSSWREKNIDDLKFYFGAANGTEVKLDWLRLEANHCWHFDDSGEIYGQNQLTGGAVSNSKFSATTTGGDGYFYFSTDKQALWQHADRAFIDAKIFKTIRVNMTSSANGTGEIIWWQRDGTIGATNFAVQSGTQTYEIDMTTEANWTNSITIFRIDPVSQTGADFSIEYVNISPKMIPPRISNSDLTVNSPLPVFLYDEPVESEYSDVTYSMELATDFDFTNVVYSAENLTGGTNIYNGNSLLDGLYWWRIRAKANDGTVSPWAIPMPIFIRIWNFDRAEDIYYAHDFSTPIVAENVWSAARDGVDPYVRFNVGDDRGINTELYPRFCCRLKADNEPSLVGSFFFFNCGDGYKNLLFSHPHNGEWQYKDIDLSSNPDWKGYAWYTRISPVLYSGNTVSLESIYFLPADAHSVEVVDTNVPGGQITVPYSHSFSATGTIEQVTWSLVSGTLPVGLTLGADGVLNGTPAMVGVSTFTVNAEDEVFRSGSKQLTVEIVPEGGMMIFWILNFGFWIYWRKFKFSKI